MRDTTTTQQVLREALVKARAALETSRIRAVSEWEVRDVTPKIVIEAIASIDAALSLPAAEVQTSELHAAIMNLPINWTPGTSIPTSYLDGHRDARHAAAELVSASLSSSGAGDAAAETGRKLKVTLQDNPTERMLDAAILSLAQISKALGIPDDEAACANGNNLILEAIAELRAASSSESDTAPNEALRLILQASGGQCENFTTGIGSCFRNGRKPDAQYGAYRCCNSCIAAHGLSASPSPASTSAPAEPTDAAKPVAWRMDFIDPHTGKWDYTVWRNKPKDYEVYPGNVVSPLYAGAAPVGEPAPDYEAWGLCSRLNAALDAIGDYAHDRSTGPAVPDALWEIRRMAYDAMDGWRLVPLEPTSDMLYAMAECDGYQRGDRDHPMLTRWEDYWRVAVAASPPSERTSAAIRATGTEAVQQPVAMQTRLGERGNCFAASLATILGLPLDAVPDFMATGEDEDQWWNAARQWLKSRGLGMVTTEDAAAGWRFDGLYIASGTTARGYEHATVYRRGKLFHDPHPDGTGLAKVTGLTFIVPLSLATPTWAAAGAAVQPKVLTPDQREAMRKAVMTEIDRRIPTVGRMHSQWRDWPGTWSFADCAVSALSEYLVRAAAPDAAGAAQPVLAQQQENKQ